MPRLSAVKTFNSSISLLGKNALVVGGTSGIGEAIARRMAQFQANVTIAGRNAAAAEGIITAMQSSHPEGQFQFSKVDMSSMKDIRRFASGLPQSDIDFLIISCGILTMQGRTETAEGIDQKLALHYYGRHFLIRELLPKLQRQADEGKEVRVMSVLAAGMGAPVEMDDLDLKKKYSVPRAAAAAPYHNDLMVEEFSKRYPDISFIHILPGFVNTPLSNLNNSVLRWLMGWIATSPEDCAEYMTYGLVHENFRKGYWLLNNRADKTTTSTHTDEITTKVWDHTVELTEKAVNS